MKLRDDSDLDERKAILKECFWERVEWIKANQLGINHIHAVNRAKKQIPEQAAREIAAREPDNGTLSQVLDQF